LKKIFFLLLSLCLFLSSCNWFKTTPQIGVILSDHFKDKLYKDFDTAAYNVVFNRHFDSLKGSFSNPKVIGGYYADQERRTSLVGRFYINGQLDSLKTYLSRSTEHGFNPRIFAYQELNQLLAKLSAHQFRSINEAYPVLADLELYSASSLWKNQPAQGAQQILRHHY